ncbi:hypothetical protein FACS189449_04550 [Alphaproteobacteria bacterium]|nr:hypothetical protein FACS189449_04550 [Alphaproteobacteria bacterium]
MLESGYLENFIRQGNVTHEVVADGRGRHLEYIPKDKLEELIIKLFASRYGTLEAKALRGTPAAIKNTPPKMLALLLLKAEFFRMLINEKRRSSNKEIEDIDDEKIDPETITLAPIQKCIAINARSKVGGAGIHALCASLTTVTVGKSPLGVGIEDVGAEELDELIFGAILDEAPYGYAEHTVEHLILVFACKVLSTRDEAQEFLKEYSKYRKIAFSNISDGTKMEDYIIRSSSIPTEVRADKISEMAEKIKEVLYQPGLPYSYPVEHDEAHRYSTGCATPIVGTDKKNKFPDCEETSIRHIFNYVLGIKGMNDIKNDETFQDYGFSGILPKYKRLFLHRRSQLYTFYKDCNSNVNGRNVNVRDLWNKVVCALNSGKDNGVLYLNQGGVNNKDSENELDAGFINVLRVMCVVIGIDPNDFLKDINLDCIEDQDDSEAQLLKIQEKFQELFKIINPAQEYDIKFDEDNVKIESGDVSGDMDVKVTGNIDGRAIDYGFKIHQEKGRHGVVTLLPSTNTLESMNMLNIDISFDEKQLVGYLFSYYKDLGSDRRQNDYHSIFSYANGNSGYVEVGNLKNSILAFQTLGSTKRNAAMEQILKNIIRDISFSVGDKHALALGVIFLTVDNLDIYRQIKAMVNSYHPNGLMYLSPMQVMHLVVPGQYNPDLLDREHDKQGFEPGLKRFRDLESVTFKSLQCDLDWQQLPRYVNTLRIDGTSGKINVDLLNCGLLHRVSIVEGDFQRVQLPCSLESLHIYSDARIDDLDLTNCKKLRGENIRILSKNVKVQYPGHLSKKETD